MQGLSVPSISTAPPIKNPLKTFNDIPDELLDKIALYADQKTLVSLASVEGRWKAPARRYTTYKARGFEQLLRFLDHVLEYPEFSRHVRYAKLLGTTRAEEVAQKIPIKESKMLATRTISAILKECPQIIDLVMGYPSLAEPAQAELGEAIGTLHLNHALISPPHHSITYKAFALAAPAFRKMDTLSLCVELGEDVKEIPHVEPCSIKELHLMVSDANIRALEATLGPLGHDVTTLDLVLTGHAFFQEESPSLTPTALRETLQPYVERAQSLIIGLSLVDPALAHPLLLQPVLGDRAWAFLSADDVQTPQITSFRWVGDAKTCLLGFAGIVKTLQQRQPGPQRSIQVHASRGKQWSEEEGAKFDDFAARMGLSTIWH